MIPVDKVREIIKKHEILEKELSSGSIEKKLFASKSKEYSELNAVISHAKDYLTFEKTRDDLKKIIGDENNDKEMIELAKIELNELEVKKDKNESKLKLFLLPKDEADTKNAIIEIRAGTGGLEASLFASDLFKMYEKVSQKKKWSLEIISISKSDAGGLKEVIASIKGRNIYSSLKYESGVHRVQRVPDTETQGRVHTSAATVAVLPEAEEVDIKIEEKDLRIDVFRSSGPGGQSVNTTDSAVRITHIPTGIVVSQQDEKSQIRNKEKGLKILRSRIYEFERNKRDEERAKDRKSKIGSGDRSERIRTYNFPQGRVTDHRINLTLHKLDEFLNGEIHDEVNAKKLPFIQSILDDSDQDNPVRIIIKYRGRSHTSEEIMSHLFLNTDLEKNIRVNLNMIGLDGKPEIKNLRQILAEWIKFRTLVVKNKLTWEITKIKDRIHILEGFIVVYKYLDKIFLKVLTKHPGRMPEIFYNMFTVNNEKVVRFLSLSLIHISEPTRPY